MQMTDRQRGQSCGIANAQKLTRKVGPEILRTENVEYGISRHKIRIGNWNVECQIPMTGLDWELEYGIPRS